MKSIAIKYGIFMFIGFVALFLLMHEVAQIRNYNLRILNGFIHISLIYIAIKKYREKVLNTGNAIVSGVIAGMYTSIIGVLPFTLFIMFYLIGDQAFMEHIKTTVPMGQYLNPLTASLFIFVEGIAISLIGSYIMDRLIDVGRTETSNA
jgi:uncharacterized membrane protein